MTDLARLQNAFIKADKAGNTEDAQAFARAIRQMQAQEPVKQEITPSQIQSRIDQGFEASETINKEELGGVDPISAKFLSGLTFGASDEIIGAIQAPIRAFRDDIPITEAFKDGRRSVNNAVKFAEQNNPVLGTVAEIGGAVASGGALARLGLLASGKLAANAGLKARTIAGVKDGAAIGAVTGFNSGEGVVDRASGAASGGITGAAVGGAVPVVAEGIRGATQGIVNQVAPRVRGAFRPEQEAQRRVAAAMDFDDIAPINQASAARNGQELLNADRGGETVRALARSVSNQNPKAREALTRETSNRFETQGQRAQALVDRLVNGQADDIGFQQAVSQAARKANAPAYRRAYNSPKAQALWDEGFEQIMQSPAAQTAAKDATKRGANRAAVDGFTPVRNPFDFDEFGRFSIKKNPDGSLALPNLAFWDSVKRGLDDQIGTAQRSGQRETAAEVVQVKNVLLDRLDTLVPEFSKARKGASEFFKAENALDAGRNFVSSNRNVRDSIRQINKMSKPEKEAFKVGFAAEIKEQIGKSRDRVNVINQIFGSQNARNKIRAALGRDASKEFESFVRVETAQDQLRTAIQGNSTTARQLVELGLARGGDAGVGFGAGGFATGDGFSLTGAVTGAVLARAARTGGAHVETKVMERVADILLSKDPKVLTNGAKAISRSKNMQKALDSYQRLIEQISISPTAAAISSQ